MSTPRRLTFTTRSTCVQMVQLVLPPHTNAHGTIFGGQLAAWIDICGAASAMRFARGQVVTASIDELHFTRPITKGMLVTLKSQVNQAWRSSMEIGVRVEAEDPVTGTRCHACSAYLTFVAIDDEGRPRHAPGLTPESDDDRRRQYEADERRDHRLNMRRIRKERRAAQPDQWSLPLFPFDDPNQSRDD